MFHDFLRDQSGATAIEYGLIVALIGMLLIFSLNALSLNIQNMYGLIANSVNTSVVPTP